MFGVVKSYMYCLAVGENYQKLIKECVALLNSLNVPISKSVYFKYNSGCSRFGYCKHNVRETSSKESKYEYTVAINRYMMRDEDVKTTIIHELLHTINHKYGHKGEWKKWAVFVRNSTPYDVERTASYQLQPAAYRNRKVSTNGDPATMYVAECPECRMRIYVRKQRGVTGKGATKYVCKKCRQRLYFV